MEGILLVRCTLGVVRVQVVRWCKGDTVKRGDFIFPLIRVLFCDMGNYIKLS